MIRAVALSCVLLVSAFARAWAQSPAPAPIVFFDIAAPDSPKLQAFYADLFGPTSLTQAGPQQPRFTPATRLASARGTTLPA